MQFRNIVVGAVAVALLTGCSFERKQVDYKAGAVQVKPLEVPPDLTTPETEQRYAIPGTDGEKAANYSEYSKKKVEPCANPAPVVAPAEPAAAASKLARLEDGKAGKRIVLGEPFDRSWRRIGLALEKAHIAVGDKDRSKGVYFVPVTIKDKKPLEYQVRVRETGEGSEALIVNASGKSDGEAVRLTELLYRNLEESAAPSLPPSDGSFFGDSVLPAR